MESLFKIFEGHWVTVFLWALTGVLIVFIGWLGMQKPSKRLSWKYRLALFGFSIAMLLVVFFMQFCQCMFVQMPGSMP